MIRGETITTAIRDLPIAVSEIQNIYITFHTITKILVEKTLEDCTIDGEVIECTLSQEDSLKLTCGPITRRVTIITKDGIRYEHSNEELMCEQTARGEVLV